MARQTHVALCETSREENNVGYDGSGEGWNCTFSVVVANNEQRRRGEQADRRMTWGEQLTFFLRSVPSRRW